MARQHPSIGGDLADFIAAQKIFFVASAAAGSRVNLSPRSTDSLRVIGPNAVAYLDRTGSGNEWAEKKGQAGIEAYWRATDTHSIDGLATGMFEDDAVPAVMPT